MDLIRQELTTGAQAETAGQLGREDSGSRNWPGNCCCWQGGTHAECAPGGRIALETARVRRLDDARLAWACQVWNRSDQPRLVIQACEQALRAGRELSLDAAAELAIAYRAEHRELDAKRAASRDAESAPAATPDVTCEVQPGRGGFF